MKNITFHDSFSPANATDSITYDNGSFQIYWLERFPTDKEAV